MDWMKSHSDWSEKISAKMLSAKGLTLEDYYEMMSLPNQPFDEIALISFAHMYHCHICVLMVERYWTTNKDQDFSRCKISLLYYRTGFL